MVDLRKWVIVLLSSLSLLAEAQVAPLAHEGQLNLSNWNFEQEPVKLSGAWNFYMSRLIAPSHFKYDSTFIQDRDFVDFPSTWSAYERTEGFATYHLKIILASHNLPLALELPQIYSSYQLWVNEKPIAKNGIVATKESESKAQWLPQTVTFQPASDTLDVVLHISNFQHYKGGIREPIFLGLANDMIERREAFTFSNIILFGGLILIGISFFFIFLFSSKELALLYFAAICLSWGTRSLFSNQYLFISYYPDFSWEMMVRIEYITLYLTMIFTILFLGKLFKSEINFFIKYILVGGNFIFILITIGFSAYIFTQFLNLYLSFCALLIVYGIFVVLRALVYERAGAWLMIMSIVLALLIFGYDLLAFEGIVPTNPLAINICYLIFFLLNGVSMLFAVRLLGKERKDSTMLRWDDLYKKD